MEGKKFASGTVANVNGNFPRCRVETLPFTPSYVQVKAGDTFSKYLFQLSDLSFISKFTDYGGILIG
ncbi:hypothetical protein D3C76_1577750 [compost metagenome]